MKNKLTILLVFVVILSFNGYSQLKVNSSGRVGIATDPDGTYKLNVPSAIFKAGGGYPDLIIGPNPSATQTRAIYPSEDNSGSIGWSGKQFLYIRGKYIYQDGSLVSSDKRLKENFRDIDTPLEKLIQIKGLKYDFKNKQSMSVEDVKEKQKLSKLESDRLGFIAQDLEKIFPEAVLYDEENDSYYVEYNAIIPIIVEAMKEQQNQIKTLQSELATCCQAKSKSASIIGADDFSNLESAKLYQNTPNPFNNETTIRFEIPENVLSAQLHICNMTGTLLKTININKTGNGQENIKANEFNAGMYLYSLVCDGRIVDTKQMMLTN